MPSSKAQDSDATAIAPAFMPESTLPRKVAAALRQWLPHAGDPPSEPAAASAINAQPVPSSRIVSTSTSPAALFMSHQHMEALAHLRYGLETGGGVILLTGPVGTGKSALCRAFLHELPAKVQAFHLSRPARDREQLMIDICRGFGLEIRPGAPIRVYIDRLNARLRENEALGRRTVLVVDDAQRLSPDLLEQLRLLTNLETDHNKLLQIVLVGQTGLRELLERPELRQLSQRIVARHQLGTLMRDEVIPYAHHKLDNAGISGVRLSRRAARPLVAWTGGVPRTLDQLLDRAVVAALAQGRTTFDATTLSRAARDIGLTTSASTWPWSSQLAGMSLTLVLSCMGGAIWMDRGTGGAVAAAAPSISPTTTATRENRVPGSPPAGSGPAVTSVQGIAQGPSAALAASRPAAPTTRPPMVALIQRWDSTASDWRGCNRLPMRLRCVTGRAKLQDLRELDLPVVLHLSDGDGRRGDALLQGVADGTAVLRFDDVLMRISVNELAQQWRGDFTALWPLPPAFSRPLRPGDRGAAVTWLRSRLSQVQPSTTPSNGLARFDSSLQAQLRAFQLREHLDADGIAGTKTLVRLTRRTDDTMPRLTARNAP